MEAWLKTIANIFDENGVDIYVVGGAVRNIQLCLPVEDYDLCGPLLPYEVKKICENHGVKTIARASDLGTISLKVIDEFGEHIAEYTTFRQDNYSIYHRPEEVLFVSDVDSDYKRRDFTINAMYLPLLPDGFGEIIDPSGGLEDLKLRRLHTVKKDAYQVLKEDGLRILRAIRFACDFSLNPSEPLLNAAKENVGLLKYISGERIYKELEKILTTDLRYPNGQGLSIKKAFDLLYDINCLPYIFPFGYAKLSKNYNFKPPAYDSNNELLFVSRLCSLFWNLEESDVRENLSYISAPKKVQILTESLLRAAYIFAKIDDNAVDSLSYIKYFPDFGPDIIIQASELLKAMGFPNQSSGLKKLFAYFNKKNFPWTLKELAIDGNDVLLFFDRIKPKNIGQLLKSLHMAVLMGKAPNKKDELLKYAKN